MPRLICLLILNLFALSLYAADTTYSRHWKDIDTTVFNRSLTRTALTKVTLLYQRAKKDNNQAQVIKTFAVPNAPGTGY
jgi:hypothetical protein